MSYSTTMPPVTASAAGTSSGAAPYIYGPIYDLTFLIGAPVLALVMGWIVADQSASSYSFMLGQSPNRLAHVLMFIFTMAHLAAVLFRSHGNPKIFRQYPLRFTFVPATLLAAVSLSNWIFASVIVLGVWWDVYHSSLQTFGLSRIYDMKRGNPAEMGRRLDLWLNLLMYCGPILAGVTLLDHLKSFESFDGLGTTMFTSFPVIASEYQRYLAWGILGVGIPYLAFYIFSYMRLVKAGYQVSLQKVALLASTAIVSIVTWGFNSFGEAFFIMNFFHALQYFAIVWWSEKRNMQRLFGYDDSDAGVRKTFLMFLTLPLIFGGTAWLASAWNNRTLLNIAIVVSIMHFWYDGFIWSVRKKQVVAA
jgi:hypothetical protein